MINRQNLKRGLLPVLVVLVVAFLGGCAVKKGDLWGDPETGLILQYRMPVDQILKYHSSEEMNQIIEVMGQTIDVEVNSKTAFSVKAKGLKEDNHQLGITIDSMSISVVSSEGELSPDLSSVIGKSFDMILSPLGKELELSGAESIQYDLPSEGKTSIASDFQAIFPNLAGRSVKIGETWTSTDTITEKSESSEIQINTESVHTLQGFETVDGMECVKITAEVTGTLKGAGEQQGMDLAFEGEIKGTDTWYFAYKKGIFVKMISTAFAEGSIEVSGPQDMSIPMTQEFKMEIKLAK
ncbi:MAG: hypothetical protein GQ536_04430 [Candidatus Aminicenantes bacterium]|nr:hypothetical protein [Candidatus Aminicenantes bacterium]